MHMIKCVKLQFSYFIKRVTVIITAIIASIITGMIINNDLAIFTRFYNRVLQFFHARNGIFIYSVQLHIVRPRLKKRPAWAFFLLCCSIRGLT